MATTTSAPLQASSQFYWKHVLSGLIDSMVGYVIVHNQGFVLDRASGGSTSDPLSSKGLRGSSLNAALKVVAAILLLAALSRSASAQTPQLKYPSYKGAVIGAAVGVGAVTGVVLYLALHKTYITGCTQSANDASSMTDEQDRRNYTLVNEGSGLKAGERVKLQGKKKKDKQGNRSFRVTKIKHDYGPCQQ